MLVKVKRTLAYSGSTFEAGTECDMDQEKVSAFGKDFVEVIETPKEVAKETPKKGKK